METNRQTYPPYFVTIGELPNLSKPFSIPFQKTNGISFKGENEQINNLIQYIVLNLFLEMDKELLDIKIIDLGINSSFPYLKDLAQFNNEVEYITTTSKLKELFKKLNERANKLNLELFTTEIPNLIEFNKQSHFKENYTFIILSDINSIEAIPLELHTEILDTFANAEKFGFYFIYNRNNVKKNNTVERNKIDINLITKQSTKYTIKNNELFISRDYYGMKAITELVAYKITNPSKNQFVEKISLIKNQNISESLQSNTQDFLKIPLGFEGKNQIYFSLGKKSSCYHTIISGQSGKGKSNILNTLILEIAKCKKPDELELYLIDYKGTEFSIYERHPNVKMIQTSNNFEETVFILGNLKIEGEKRRSLLSGKAKDIDEYNSLSEVNKLPHIILIIDEFQTIYDKSERNDKKGLNSVFKEIARTYRAFGIYFIICSQKVDDAEIDDDLINQSQCRILTAMTGRIGSKILSYNNNIELSNLELGTVLFNNKNGNKDGNVLVKMKHISTIKEINLELDEILKYNPRKTTFINIQKQMAEYGE